MIRLLMMVTAALCFVGCTSIDVSPLPYDSKIKEICLIDNPKVIVDDFVPVMERTFARYGIGLRRVSEFTQLRANEYGIRYSARQSWDLTTYLSDAFVNVYKGNMLIAEGRYHLIGGSFCMSLFKWQGTETKMKPVYDELLQNFPKPGQKEP